MADTKTLQEQIEGLRRPNDSDNITRHAYNRALNDVLALIAEQGATGTAQTATASRETEPLSDGSGRDVLDVSSLLTGDLLRRVLRAAREATVHDLEGIKLVRVVNGVAIQLSQEPAFLAALGTGSRLVGLLKRCRDFVCSRSCPHHQKWHTDLCLLLKGAIEVQPAVAEGSPQPASPPGVYEYERMLATAAEGGDTLTPETPLESQLRTDALRYQRWWGELAPARDASASVSCLLDAIFGELGERSRERQANVDRLEAQAARIAALESTLRLFAEHRWIPESFQDTARRALVGEEAPAVNG